jgi:hypothetical protein
VEKLKPGEDYEVALEDVLNSCVALLAVIGPRWSTITSAGGRRRLDDPEDWVRTEISRALARGVHVIPVLISPAIMPRDAEVPRDLKPLLKRQACEFSDRHWKQDLELLAQLLENIPGIRKRDWEDERSRAVFRSLVADLENLEQALHSLGAILDHPDQGQWMYSDLLHMVEVAAQPLCDARKSVSELGDQSTCRELVAISNSVEVIKILGAHTAGVGGEAFARLTAETVQKLREKLLPRT